MNHDHINHDHINHDQVNHIETSLPPVLLIHGFAASFELDWVRSGFAERLAASGRTVLPCDLPGHGSSPRDRHPEAYLDLAGSLEQFLPGDPVDAVGFSLGGMTLLQLAVVRPERFRRIVLVGVGDFAFRPRAEPEQIERLALALEHGVRSDDDDDVRRFHRMATRHGNDPLAMAAFVRRPDPRLTRADVPRITCPTLVVLGERDFAGPADELLTLLPDVEQVIVPVVDHFSTVRSEVFQASAIDFLATGAPGT